MEARMMDFGPDLTKPSELTGLAADCLETQGPDLMARWERHQAFWDSRVAEGLAPYLRSVVSRNGPEATVMTRNGQCVTGVNFASQDYLSLNTHPSIREAGVTALNRHGAQSGGPLMHQGGSTPVSVLEARLAEFLGCQEVALFSSGWNAGYGAIRALVRETDHVVIDVRVSAGLREGAACATRHVHRVPHLSREDIAACLRNIRETHPWSGVLVVTESLFAMEATVPDLRALQELCRAHGATLMVDVSHDLGAIGLDGTGFLGMAGLIGAVDLVTGSLAKCFAAAGGFVASSFPGVRLALNHFAAPLAASCAMSPVQAEIALAALDIITSEDGVARRARLMGNAWRLRERLKELGFQPMGRASAIVPVPLGSVAMGRLMTRAALADGALVNLLEHPVTARHEARWRLLVMADHTKAQIDRMVEVAARARDLATQELRKALERREAPELRDATS
jgi:glycine C-acetyltransferase